MDRMRSWCMVVRLVRNPLDCVKVFGSLHIDRFVSIEAGEARWRVVIEHW